jgi:hypothetical protein
VSNWLVDFYRDIRPNARWDIVKGAVITVIALVSWLASRQELFGIPPLLIGIAVFAVLSFALAAIAFLVFVISKLREKTPEPQIADPDLHEKCEGIISNHESTILKLRERNEAQEIKVSAQEDQIKRLQVELNEFKWLRDLADDQASSIFRFVQITKCTVGKREFQRNDPYLEFVLAVDNRSVYDVNFAELNGSISFKDWQLTGALTWIERSAPTHGNVGQVIIRQALDRQDVIHILNGSPNVSFDFSRLQIGISRNGTQPQSAQVSHLSVTNEDLLKTYPKLAIQIRDSVFSWLIYDPPQLCNEPCIVTLLLKLTNDRQTTITIETVKLATTINLSKHVAYAESGLEVWPRRYVSAGRDGHQGNALPNLNATTPLKLAAGESVDGALQFKFDSIRYMEPTGNAVEHEQFRLFLIDTEGECHPAFCTLSPLKN